MPPRGLGRGLSALIPGAQDVSALPPIATVVTGVGASVVPVDAIVPNPLQPRSDFDPEELDALVASVREHGILQPLLVRPSGDGRYELIVGERRLRAAKRAGLTDVPVVVRSDIADDRTKLEIAIIENVQRLDLNPVERAVAYRKLQERFGMTQEEIARRVGIARSSIAHTMRILALPEDMLDALRRGNLTEGHAKVLVGIEDPGTQRAWFDRILGEGIPVAAITGDPVAGDERPAAPRGASRASDVNLRARERALEQRLGVRVRIRGIAAGGGAITIRCGDDEELHGVIDAILTA